jgi:16S rRNA (uracil1498-N3)-methyltransferase
VVDRDDRPPVATFFTNAAFAARATVSLSEAAAHHARVKRLTVGDRVRLTDGNGRVALGAITSLREDCDVAIESVNDVPRQAPIHLKVPIGDRDRMLLLAEKATELGVDTWQAVRFRRSMSVNPRGEGASFAEKIRARMVSALEQSGGAWLPRQLPDVAPQDVTGTGACVLLDIEGEPLLRGLADVPECSLLFGPEGGLEVEERNALLGAGWRPACLAATTLRFETAGIAAVAVVRAAQMLRET